MTYEMPATILVTHLKFVTVLMWESLRTERPDSTQGYQNFAIFLKKLHLTYL